jgi:CLIP-associating protein 1/2
MTSGQEESLLLAQTIPIPDDDSDSDGDQSINLMSFSAPFEVYPPITPLSKSVPKSNSRVQSLSPGSSHSKPTISVSNALSSDSIPDSNGRSQPVVEDALRARAEQAESAAERLLELVEPDEEGMLHSIPASLLVGSSNGHVTMKPKNKPAPISLASAGLATPVTPMNRHAAIMKQAAMFKDSPEYSRRTSSLIDVLHDKKHETGWWLKRRACVFFLFTYY